MEPAIIAALVAGAVSLVGLVVQLLIARQSRIAQREAIATKAEIENSKNTISELRSLECDTESVRILAWRVLSMIRDMPELGTHDSDQSRKFLNCATKFSNEAARFLESWATVKYEIDEEYNEYLRHQRHECRHLIAGARAVVERIHHDLESSSLSTYAPKYLADLENYINLVLPQLDTFGRGVAVVRHKINPFEIGG